jgi:hypothetical protein
MSRLRFAAGSVTLLALMSTPPSFLIAQEQPRAETPSPPPPAPVAQARNVQVDVTVTLQGGGATPVTKKMSLVAADRQVALGRSGIEVAVQAPPSPALNYRTVGLNVDARPQLQPDNRISLMVKLNFSAILKREPGDTGPPSFGSSSTELNLLLDSGRPITIAQAADAEIGRAYSVEVKATILK